MHDLVRVLTGQFKEYKSKRNQRKYGCRTAPSQVLTIRCIFLSKIPIKTYRFSNYVNIVLEGNYYFSAVLLIILALSPFFGKEGLFGTDTEIYGPLGNNLRIIGLYLALMELFLWIYCLLKRNLSNVAMLGVFYLLIPNAVQMYSEINGLPFDSDPRLVFWYVGLSHIAFGLFVFRIRRTDE